MSTLFKSNVIVNANTSQDFLKLTKKCKERVQKLTSKGIMFTPPKFNYDQCKYLADKLRLVVESAETLPPEDITKCFEVIKLLYGFANAIENFIQNCLQDTWIQVAMTMTNLSEHISSLGFYLEAISQSFRGILASTSIDGIYQSEVKIVEEKASFDKEQLLRKLNALLQSKPTTWKVYQLATLLLERLQQPQRHQDCSTPRFFRIDTDHLKEKEQLGRGAFATVFKASWLGIEVAKKTFYARDSPDFEKEVSILQVLSHPNIVSLFGYAKDDQECFMIMELMDEDLFSLIRRRMKENKKQGYPFDIFEAMDMMLQIGGGMKYLHEMRIVHRDLKSMNILVKYMKTKDMKIAYVSTKVSDFGLSRVKQHSLTQSNQTPNMGTARWMAPEMIKLHLVESSIEISSIDDNDVGGTKHPFKSDVYSFAMVCYEILSGELPFFEEHNLTEVKKKILRGDRPQLPHHCPPGIKSLMEKCWNADAKKRPCFSDIFKELQHLQCSLLMSRLTFYQKRIQLGNNIGTIKFTIGELIKITNNFSDYHEIGSGLLGTFYRGILSDGTLLVIWRPSPDYYTIFFDNIQAEFRSFNIRERHPNLLRIVGDCVTPNECFLVYPYMSNGTVHSQLQKVGHGEPTLNFKMRKHIALGVAKGMAYLHEECNPKIAHHNIISSKIFLDDEYEAFISDFKYCKVLDVVPMNSVHETLSFLALEHFDDVYSYGVVLLELITAQNSWLDKDYGVVCLVDWVKIQLINQTLDSLDEVKKLGVDKFNVDKFELIVDSNLKDYNVTELKDLLHVALLCTQHPASTRPKMSEVVKMLQREQP